MDATTALTGPLQDGLSELKAESVAASDLMVVNAARVSFGERSEDMGAREKGLINFLMRERHGTPFEHNMFTFYVKCPIFVAREWVRHRIGSFNEFSGRYKEMRPHFYIPADENVRSQVGKPGAYSFEPVDEDLAQNVKAIMKSQVEVAWYEYQWMVDQVVAKEVARMILPLNIYTEFYWTINARSLMNFISLRISEHAQYEIRCYAEDLLELFREAMPITCEAFEKNGMVAP